VRRETAARLALIAMLLIDFSYCIPLLAPLWRGEGGERGGERTSKTPPGHAYVFFDHPIELRTWGQRKGRKKRKRTLVEANTSSHKRPRMKGFLGKRKKKVRRAVGYSLLLFCFPRVCRGTGKENSGKKRKRGKGEGSRPISEIYFFLQQDLDTSKRETKEKGKREKKKKKKGGEEERAPTIRGHSTSNSFFNSLSQPNAVRDKRIGKKKGKRKGQSAL